MFQLTCDCSFCESITQSYIDHNCANAVSLHNAFRAHLFTCSEQFNSFIMEQYLSDCLINPSEQTLDFVDSFYEE